MGFANLFDNSPTPKATQARINSPITGSPVPIKQLFIYFLSLTSGFFMNKITLSILILAATSAQAEVVDNRQILMLSEPQRGHVLTEMRALLAGTQNILGALATDDMAAVTRYAKPLGMGMADNAEKHLKGVLPQEFMQLGMSVHKDFDLLAADAESIKDPKHTLKQLSEAMSKCNACHASYQIRTGMAAQTAGKASEARLDEVAQRGRHVMPFNLEQTTHVFSRTENGGVQQVIVKDKSNAEQIKLIREHLAKISHEFTQGDFSNPAKIHGDTMPGLNELRKAKPGQIKIDYKELTDGAEITYSTDDANFINALHQWFDAQLSDHARHAVTGHTNHSMHGN
jgi:hypothetical protein